MRRATKAKKDESGDGKLMVEDQQPCCRKKKTTSTLQSKKNQADGKIPEQKTKEAVKKEEKEREKFEFTNKSSFQVSLLI